MRLRASSASSPQKRPTLSRPARLRLQRRLLGFRYGMMLEDQPTAEDITIQRTASTCTSTAEHAVPRGLRDRLSRHAHGCRLHGQQSQRGFGLRLRQQLPHLRLRRIARRLSPLTATRSSSAASPRRLAVLIRGVMPAFAACCRHDRTFPASAASALPAARGPVSGCRASAPHLRGALSAAWSAAASPPVSRSAWCSSRMVARSATRRSRSRRLVRPRSSDRPAATPMAGSTS